MHFGSIQLTIQVYGYVITRKALILFAMLFLSACALPNKPRHPSESIVQAITTESGLIYEVIETGSGPLAQVGDMALIHETMKRGDGTMIADTWAMNHPIRILLGGNQAIAGLDEAITGMRVGERRELIVPPSLSRRTSYPENGLFGPADTLYYDVLLLQTSKE